MVVAVPLLEAKIERERERETQISKLLKTKK